MNQTLLAKLEQLGLTHNEATVYLVLLEIGSTTTKAIIEKSGMHTSKVYECLERLIQKGLVYFIVEANRKKFQAADPKSIIAYLEEKQVSLEEQKQEFQKLIPTLSSLGRPHPQQSATVFQGLKGYKAMLDNMLKEIGKNGQYDAFASGMLKEILGPYWYQFQRKKKELGISSRAVWDEKVREKKAYLKEYFGSGRFIADYPVLVDIFIYGDSVLIVSYTDEPLFAVHIQSKGLKKSYSHLFEALWKTGTN